MRHVFVFVDGTGCTLETKTNIGSAYALIADSDTHSRYYQTGIGALSRTRLFDNILAPNVDLKVIEAYQALLALNLSSEDQIFIFGYSRGAVVARRLAMCVASKERLIQLSLRGLDLDRSVRARVSFLCLFDPVIGWPRVYGSKVPDHDAIMEIKIGSYLELIALEEVRLTFPSDSYFASPTTRRRIATLSSTSRADTTEDRENTQLELMLMKTRKSVWFPGTHADVGGHGQDKKIGAHALATSLEELFCLLPTNVERSAFNASQLKAILDVCSSDERSQPRRPNMLASLWRRLVGLPLRRVPKNRKLVQHLIHQTCVELGNDKHLDQYPQYPNYTTLASDPS